MADSKDPYANAGVQYSVLDAWKRNAQIAAARTADSLQRSIWVVERGEELAAEELRTAVHSLGRLLGRVDVEDVLDAIFREFCVGK